MLTPPRPPPASACAAPARGRGPASPRPAGHRPAAGAPRGSGPRRQRRRPRRGNGFRHLRARGHGPRADGIHRRRVSRRGVSPSPSFFSMAALTRMDALPSGENASFPATMQRTTAIPAAAPFAPGSLSAAGRRRRAVGCQLAGDEDRPGRDSALLVCLACASSWVPPHCSSCSPLEILRGSAECLRGSAGSIPANGPIWSAFASTKRPAKSPS